MRRAATRTYAYWWRRPQVWVGIAAYLLACWSFAIAPVLPDSHHPQAQIVSSLPPPPNCHKVACIALTFDDGPNRTTTTQILNTLEKERVPATFFVIGSRVAAQADLIRRMHADGDEVGNHSWSHPEMTKLKPPKIHEQIAWTQAAIEKAGAPAPTLFRPPYGEVNKTMRKYIPMTFMFWNEDPRDWEAKRSSQVVRAVESSAHPGGVIDMHDIYANTAAALPKVVHDLKARGYHFVTASQLLELHPGQRGDFYGRPIQH